MTRGQRRLEQVGAARGGRGRREAPRGVKGTPAAVVVVEYDARLVLVALGDGHAVAQLSWRARSTLPRLARALASGELSYAKVRALTRVTTPETEELLVVARRG